MLRGSCSFARNDRCQKWPVPDRRDVSSTEDCQTVPSTDTWPFSLKRSSGLGAGNDRELSPPDDC
eukprot:2074614-Prymnesium_polylepis.2